MVRTSGGIRISAGKSSKKSGGGTSGGSSRSASSASGKSSGKGSTRLPPIPHCEAPSWQKPITNFFNSDAGPSKNAEPEIDQNERMEEECSSENKENTDEIVNGSMSEKSAISKDDNSDKDGPSHEKRRKEENGKENVEDNTSN